MTKSELKLIIKECYIEIKNDDKKINEDIGEKILIAASTAIASSVGKKVVDRADKFIDKKIKEKEEKEKKRKKEKEELEKERNKEKQEQNKSEK